MKRFFESLKRERDDVYFELTDEERKAVAHRIKMMVIEETIKVLGGWNKENIRFIMDISIENLQSLLSVFEDMELYSKCAMMADAIKEIENDIKELVTTEL
jgi:hypothetical protein